MSLEQLTLLINTTEALYSERVHWKKEKLFYNWERQMLNVH